MGKAINFEDFMNNEELKEKLGEAKNEADVQDAFASAGIEASEEDIIEMAAAIQAESLKDGGDLSADQLEAVSGGICWPLAIIVGGAIGKKAGDAIYKFGKKRGWFN